MFQPSILRGGDLSSKFRKFSKIFEKSDLWSLFNIFIQAKPIKTQVCQDQSCYCCFLGRCFACNNDWNYCCYHYLMPTTKEAKSFDLLQDLYLLLRQALTKSKLTKCYYLNSYYLLSTKNSFFCQIFWHFLIFLFCNLCIFWHNVVMSYMYLWRQSKKG